MQFFTQLLCVMGCIQSSLFIPLYLTPVWILAVLWYLNILFLANCFISTVPAFAANVSY